MHVLVRLPLLHKQKRNELPKKLADAREEVAVMFGAVGREWRGRKWVE